MISEQFSGIFRILLKGEKVRESGLEILNSRLRILSQLKEMDKPRMGELAAELGVTLPALTNMVGKMENEKLLKRCKDNEDARAVRLIMSIAGKKLIESQLNAHQQKMARILARMNRRERTRFLQLLKELHNLLVETQSD